jgi:flagellar biosynthetic protein FliP
MNARARLTVRRRAPRARFAVALLLLLGAPWLLADVAGAQVPEPPPAPTAPPTPSGAGGAPTTTQAPDDDGRVSIDLDLGELGDPDAKGEPSNTIVVLVGLTVLAIAPALVVMMTSFTRMAVVLGIARNAVGMQTIPPNQVLTGLAVFLSLFVMAPTIKDINDTAWQPYQHGEITQREALKKAEVPIKTFMLKNTRREELDLMLDLSKSERPEKPEDTSLMSLIPAFVLSELKSAFIIGVMVLLPFLVIDLVVSSGLMSLGMMMLPPVFVSLPFKLLLFVMVDGWAMIAHALVANYH